MLKNYFKKIFPNKQYETEYKDGTAYYIFYTDTDVDVVYSIAGNTVEEIESSRNFIQEFISREAYTEGVNLFDAYTELDYDLDLLSKAIDKPLQPICDEDYISKEQMVTLVNKMKLLCEKIESELK